MVRNPRLKVGPSTSDHSATSYTYYNKTFDDINDLFLFACSHGDYMLVYNLLEAGEAKADVSDKMGRSALQLAVENEHFEVVRVLLNAIPYENFRDALLLAIYLGHTNIADFILNHQTYRTFSGGFLDPTDPRAYDDAQFSSDITPLILAAQYNRLPIVHQLLSKGERIKKPHASMCPCVDCVENSASDSFRQAQVRLSAYKGLSSEVYIVLAYPDPILQAFELSHELRALAKVEHYFCKEYKKLANQLSVFVAQLLDNVRGHEELEIVLNKTGLPHEEKYENLARFGLAIQYREKPFVSHSNCQQKLIEKWYENVSIIKNAHIIKRSIFYLGYIICFPLVVLTYKISPKSKIGLLVCIINSSSLIIASSYFSAIDLEKTNFLSNYSSTIYTNYIQLIYRNIQLKYDIIGTNENNNDTIDSIVNCDISLRFMEPNLFQIAIFIWIIGFAKNEIKQIFSLGVRVYLKVPSNYVDCSMNILFIFYFIFLFSSMIYTRLAMNTIHSSNYWANIARYERMSDIEKQYYVSKTRHILYWLNADRFYWESGDLQNLAEAFFAMGNVVSICRLCFLLPISAFVGPLQVMLDRMIIDIAKWIGIIIIFFIAFNCSLYFIFSFFSAVLEQQNTLVKSLYNSSSSISIIAKNSTTAIYPQCPDYFYQLLNQTISLLNNTLDKNNNIDTNDFCQQSSNYNKLTKIGHYPAIYYFGESFKSTLLTTFFTLFGVIGENGIPDRGYEVITRSCYKPDPTTYIPDFDGFSSNLGFVIYGLFTFVCVTVLINTLIVMLEETIEDIDDRADIEWKFARSKLYMEYIQDENILPIPLNILPSPRSIINLLKRIKQMITFNNVSRNDNNKNAVGKKTEHLTHVNIGLPNKTNVRNNDTELHDFKNEKIFKRKRSYVSNDNLTYKIVIERIVKRFLLYYKSNRTGLEQFKDGFEYRDIKNDISSFSFELFYEMDTLDETYVALAESMKKFNKNLNEHFDFEKIKHQLNKQKSS
ncbi:unnamed protein product [Rotaria sp. Silwood1]|nr:unnamed protein product [Rotaria sp. Silwood1]CAF3433800.1 unnamed protein product [Rotaria sp. Silwood1]CAF4530427.1 unnamed protein product [Rotaria sp. Silwood1]